MGTSGAKTRPTGSRSFPGSLLVQRLALFKSFDGRLLILGAGETSVLFQPVNGVIQVTDIVLRVIPTPDRLAVQDAIDRGGVSENVLGPPRAVQAAEQRAFRAVDLIELHARVTMHILKRPGRYPTTAARPILQMNLGLVQLAGRSGGGDYIPVAHDFQPVVGQLRFSLGINLQDAVLVRSEREARARLMTVHRERYERIVADKRTARLQRVNPALVGELACDARRNT